MSTTTFVTWFSVVSAAQAAPAAGQMTTAEQWVTFAGYALFVVLLISGGLGTAAYFGLVQGAAIKRVIGFVFFAALSHIIILRAAPDIAAAMVGIFLVTVACAVVAYLTWDRTFLESMVYYNGVILLVAGFYGTLLLAAYDSEYGKAVRAKAVEVRKELAKPIDDYLAKKKAGGNP